MENQIVTDDEKIRQDYDKKVELQKELDGINSACVEARNALKNAHGKERTGLNKSIKGYEKSIQLLGQQIDILPAEPISPEDALHKSLELIFNQFAFYFITLLKVMTHIELRPTDTLSFLGSDLMSYEQKAHNFSWLFYNPNIEYNDLYFEEALVKIYKAGKPSEMFFEVLAENTSLSARTILSRTKILADDLLREIIRSTSKPNYSAVEMVNAKNQIIARSNAELYHDLVSPDKTFGILNQLQKIVDGLSTWEAINNIPAEKRI